MTDCDPCDLVIYSHLKFGSAANPLFFLHYYHALDMHYDLFWDWPLRIVSIA